MKENNKKNDNSLDSKNDKENINKDDKNQSNGRQIKNIKFNNIKMDQFPNSEDKLMGRNIQFIDEDNKENKKIIMKMI
jgi:hypothetical protein